MLLTTYPRAKWYCVLYLDNSFHRWGSHGKVTQASRIYFLDVVHKLRMRYNSVPLPVLVRAQELALSKFTGPTNHYRWQLCVDVRVEH